MLLVCDLDGTLIPLEGMGDFTEATKAFSAEIASAKTALAYATGRRFEHALEGIGQFSLPTPQCLICDVGTSVYLQTGARASNEQNTQWKLSNEYSQSLTEKWSGANREDIATALKSISYLVDQEPTAQGTFKVSYYAPLDLKKEVIGEQIAEELAKKRLLASIIYSVDTKRQCALVDILPPETSKKTAVEWLRLNSDLEHEQLVYAGDSGNDLEPILAGYNAIVVANTREPLKETIGKLAQENELCEKIFFASKECIAGVLEGCEHFGLFSA